MSFASLSSAWSLTALVGIHDHLVRYSSSPATIFAAASMSRACTFGLVFYRGAGSMAPISFLPLYFQAALGAGSIQSGVIMGIFIEDIALPRGRPTCVRSLATAINVVMGQVISQSILGYHSRRTQKCRNLGSCRYQSTVLSMVAYSAVVADALSKKERK